MVNIENLFNNAFAAIKKNPIIMLPLVLKWIPQAAITLSFNLIVYDIISSYTLNDLVYLIKSDLFGSLLMFLDTHKYHLGSIISAMILAVFINSLVNAIYPIFSYQVYYRRPISLSEAFSVAKSRYLKVLWTNIIFESLTIMVILGLLFGAIIIFAVMSALLGLAGILIGSILAMGAIFMLVAAILYLTALRVMLEPVVVIENQYGGSAISRSMDLMRGRLVEVWIFLILLFISNGLYAGMSGFIAGMFLFILGDYTQILVMILLLLPQSFVLLSYGLLYLEISPVSVSLLGYHPLPR